MAVTTPARYMWRVEDISSWSKPAPTRQVGIEGFQLDPPLAYDTVETTAATSLTLVADIVDLPFAELA
jgi:hypothetical protein